jgi:hydroxymethylpyrimidine pyrophosphatase-like HAD family hydrolase
MKQPKIIAVNFDGTLCQNAFPKIGAANWKVISYIKQQKKEGAALVLWTMREGRQLQDAIDWCTLRGIAFEAVNDNTASMKAFYQNNPRKVFFNELIEDKALIEVDKDGVMHRWMPEMNG